VLWEEADEATMTRLLEMTLQLYSKRALGRCTGSGDFKCGIVTGFVTASTDVDGVECVTREPQTILVDPLLLKRVYHKLCPRDFLPLTSCCVAERGDAITLRPRGYCAELSCLGGRPPHRHR